MKTLFGFDSLPALPHPVVTVGSYDGVHCGHRILLDETRRRAAEAGGCSVVVTFEPHPRITLHDDEGLKLLTTLKEKRYLLERSGIDVMLVAHFDEAFSRLSREEFVNGCIIGKIGAEQLVVGYNHRFGHNNEGDYAYLAASTPLTVVEIKQHLVEEDKVSSTVIRSAIGEGRMELANRLLGHPYIIMGDSGRNGSFTVDRYKLLPPPGVYGGKANGKNAMVRIKDGGTVECSYAAPGKVILEL